MKNPDRLVLARIYGNLAANAVSMGEDSSDSYFQEAMSLLEENTNDPADKDAGGCGCFCGWRCSCGIGQLPFLGG